MKAKGLFLTIEVGQKRSAALQGVDSVARKVPSDAMVFDREPRWFSSKPKVISIVVAENKTSAMVVAERRGITRLTATWRLPGSKIQRMSQVIKVVKESWWRKTTDRSPS
jgi:hypothetical protein